MWCNENEYNEQRGTTKDWLFPFVRLEAIVSGVSVISDFPINYQLAVFLQGAATELYISISVISKALGHHSETTTQIYLNSIKSSEVDDANAKILAAL